MSHLALWALVIGVLSLCVGPLGVAAIVLGVIAITRTSGPDGHGGLGLAIAGTVLGVVGTLGTCLMAGILLPAIGAARSEARAVMSEAKLRQLQMGMANYHADNGGVFPPADNWQPVLMDSLVGDSDDTYFTSPLSDGDDVEYVFVPDDGYAFDGTRIMFYEDPDHRTRDGRVLVVYDDGRTDRVTVEELERFMTERGHTVRR